MSLLSLSACRKTWPAVSLVCALAVASHILLFKLGFWAISADESGRTLLAEAWRTHKTSLSSIVTVWLPFHTIAVGLALDLWPNLLVAPRILTISFGIALIATLARLAFHLFGSSRVAVVTAVLVACYPDRILLASVGLSEIMFHEFLVLAAIFLLTAFRSSRAADLLAGGAFLAVASTIRYEGWLFAFAAGVITGYLWLRKQVTTPSCLFFALIVSSFPIAWLVLEHITYGSATGAWRYVGEEYQRAAGNSLITLVAANTLTNVLIRNVANFNLIGILGVMSLARKDRAVRHLAITASIALAMMSAVQFFGRGLPSHSFWRVATSWSLLLLPFTAFVAVRAAARFAEEATVLPPSVRRCAALLLVGGLFAGSFLLPTSHAIQWYIAGERDTWRTGAEIAGLLSASTSQRVLLETRRHEYLHVVVASNKPSAFLHSTDPSARRAIEALSRSPLPDAARILAENDVGWLVFENPAQQLSIDASGVAQLHRIVGRWRIYRVSAVR